MAPRGAATAKQHAKANPKGEPASGRTNGDSELDETKFASLTTDMCLPHYFGLNAPLEFARGQQKELLASFPEGLFVSKGEAGPSVIPSVEGDATPHDQSDEEILSLRDEVAALYAVIRDRDSELAQLRTAGTQARESEPQESEQAWKAGEEERLKAAETKWQEDSKAALAQAESEAEAARAELTALKATLAQRDSELAQLRADAEQARETGTQAKDLVREAEQSWKVAEAERLKAAEAKWQEDAKAALAQAKSEADSAREEFAALKITMSERDNELAQMRAAAEQASDTHSQEAKDLVREAEVAWKAAEEARFAAAEVKWRENSIGSLTRLRTESEAARAKSEDELHRAREEAAALKASLSEETVALKAALAERDAKLAERDAKLAETASGAEQVAAALHKAKAAWKTEESAHLAAAEAQWRKQSANALADATARYEAAEGALAQLRHDATRNTNKIELTSSRSALGPESRGQRSGGENDRPKKHTVRDICIVGALATAVFLFYPYVLPYLPQSVRANIVSFTGGLGPVGGASGESPSPNASGHAVVARDVNLRSGPSATAKVVSTLPRGTKLTTLEHKGNWTSVEVESDKPNAKSVQGWVFDSFLKEDADGAQPAESE